MSPVNVLPSCYLDKLIVGEGTGISRTEQGSVSCQPSLKYDSPRRVLFSEILLSENNIIVVLF